MASTDSQFIRTRLLQGDAVLRFGLPYASAWAPWTTELLPVVPEP